jgi:precorrin-6A/cobalt-precorrin-6A reductase
VRVLVLGGTGEARELAVRLTNDGIEVTTSLAGEVTRPALPLGDVRIGGFGGVAGLHAYLRATNPSVVVDATHPFARLITEHAVQACAETATPLVVLRRPGWTAGPGDNWIRLSSIDAAAAYVRGSPPGTVLLTTGRNELAAFADDDSHAFVVRSIDPPDARIPPRMTLVLDRGPYLLESELGLMQAHDVRLLVTKDSGGPLTIAKLAAARQLGLTVALVDRPALPAGVTALDSVDAVLSRLPAWA